ncbi:hypothetical protein BJX66DRAFT_333340 [Aspergillus keveii]|uniref:Uncharacterized protein n=1 Tax=Aspergillus keveii TaxID=714993 RepID=A0ABR4GLM0_9EURO
MSKNEPIPCHGIECTRSPSKQNSIFPHLTFKVTINYIYTDDPRRQQHLTGPVINQQAHTSQTLSCFAGAARHAISQLPSGPAYRGIAKMNVKLGDFELMVGGGGDAQQPGCSLPPAYLMGQRVVPLRVLETVDRANGALARGNPVAGCGYQSQLMTVGEVKVLVWVERRR